jgi:hypothetical protein
MTCPGNPPPPPGYGIWKGAVPTPLTQWAMALRDNINNGFAYGTTWSIPYGDQVVIARKDHHTYTWKKGILLTDICIPGITLYAPLTIASVPPAGTITTPPGTAAPRTLGADETAIANPNAGPASTPDQVVPDPSLAVFSAAPTDWTLVVISAGAGAAVVGLFLLAMHHAGHVAHK